MLSAADVQHRLLAALAEPMEGAEGRKRALFDCLRVLAWAEVRHAIAGDLGLFLRAMRPSSMRLELAVGGLGKVPWGALQAEGFTIGKTSCSRSGTAIRFRVVRPAALARAETFGKLAVLGASDLLSGKLADANARWMPPHARGRAVDEAERLLEQNPVAADDVDAKRTLKEAREKLAKWKGVPMTTKLQSLIGVAKELFTLFGVIVLLVGCDGGASPGAGVDGGGGGGQVTPVTGAACQGGTLCPIGACAGGPSYTSVCCNGCSFSGSCEAFGTMKNGMVCGIWNSGTTFLQISADPHCGCFEATKCNSTNSVLNVDACGVCHTVGDKLSYITATYSASGVATEVTRTLTCVSSSSGATWR